VPPEKEGLVHLVGMGLLMLLVVVVTFNDVLRLIRG
jgi:regulator of sigma E protease